MFRLQGSDRSLQGIHAVGVLPLHAQILAAHVAVGGQLAVDGLAQVQLADDGGGGQVKHLAVFCVTGERKGNLKKSYFPSKIRGTLRNGKDLVAFL